MTDTTTTLRYRLFNNLPLATRSSSEVPWNRAALQSCSQTVSMCGCTGLSYIYTHESVSLIEVDLWLPPASKCICYLNVMGNKANFLIGTALVLYQIIAIWSEQGWVEKALQKWPYFTIKMLNQSASIWSGLLFLTAVQVCDIAQPVSKQFERFQLNYFLTAGI